MDDPRYYTALAAAFVRGKLGIAADLPVAEQLRIGLAAGLRLHKFKRRMLGDAGARKVTCEHVLNHIVVVARIGT